METNKRKLQIRAFEFLDRNLPPEIKKSLDSSQMDCILRCIVNWLYVDRNEINLCVLLDITNHIAKRAAQQKILGQPISLDPVLDDNPDFLRDLQKL